MNLKKFLPVLFSLLFVCTGLIAREKGEKDPLHKRDFNLGLSEMKDGQPQKKNISDLLSFKDGKVYSGFLADKFGYKWIKYRINKDSIYTDIETDSEVRMLVIEATTTDEANTTLAINLTIEDWDIEGTFKITKNDKPKKFYEVVGREKGGKPKKEKKKKDEAKPADAPKPE